MIMTRVKAGLLAGLIGAVLAGCTLGTGPLTQSFGQAQTMAKTSQRLNPEASANLEPVEGLNGEAAKQTLEKYYRSFEREERRTQFVLPIARN